MCCLGTCAVWVHVLCGYLCCVGTCAVWVPVLCGYMYVLSGYMCCVGTCAVWVHVLSGYMCCLGVCTVWVLAIKNVVASSNVNQLKTVGMHIADFTVLTSA